MGGAVTLVSVLVLGVGVGSLTEERTSAALVINASLFAAVFTGGAVAGCLSRRRNLTAGALSAAPVATLAVLVQLVRRTSDSQPVPWLGLPLAVLLTASLGILGALLGSRFSSTRRSLYN